MGGVGAGFTVGEYLDVLDPEGRNLERDEWRWKRIRRLNGLQIALDVIAYAQNVPLRLFRRERLERLPQAFTEFVRHFEEDVTTVLGEHGPEAAKAACRADPAATLLALRLPEHLEALRDWVLSLAGDRPMPRPAQLPDHYEHWVLELLPHAERELWLTDMSNPHPAHAMARMVEHWALYVLMWSWKHHAQFFHDWTAEQPTLIPGVLGLDRLGVAVMPAFHRHGLHRKSPQEIGLLVGPFELEPDALGSSYPPAQAGWFVKGFQRFIRNASQVPGWEEATDKAPSAEELLDAFCARAPLPGEEARRRAQQSLGALALLRSARMSPHIFHWSDGSPGRPMSRANWETLGALCTWVDRWTPRLVRTNLVARSPQRPVRVSIPRHRLALDVRWHPHQEGREPVEYLAECTVLNTRFPATSPSDSSTTTADEVLKELDNELRDLWIEPPKLFLDRARQRQYALWATQISAIGRILARHSRHEQLDLGLNGPESAAGPRCHEADPLLKNYAARVCRLIWQMTRAHETCVLWLDYSEPQPQLRHVGGAERLIQHRARRGRQFAEFSHWADGQPLKPDSESQLYRAIAKQEVDPSERKASQPASHQPVRSKFAEAYAPPGPLDAIAVPMVHNGRVLGAFNVVGVASIRQFDSRLYAPLREVAQLLAITMSRQVELIQLWKLNRLASTRPLEEWRQHSLANRFNPLGPVAKILANLFLCPVVNIWLLDKQRMRTYTLHGYTHGELFAERGERAPSRAPSFTMPASGGVLEHDAPLELPLAALAIDMWRSDPKPRHRGLFVQARYDGEESRATAGHGWRLASRGDLLLHRDYLDAAMADPAKDAARARILGGEHRLWQSMAFPLIGTVGSEPIGVVSLHAGDPLAGSHREDATGMEAQPPWPTAWRHLVAYVQTYLPYVLMQAEAIANPLDNMRRYLLHEGRTELSYVQNATHLLHQSLHTLVAPDGQLRSWIERTLPRLEAAQRPAESPAPLRELAGEITRQLGWIEKTTKEANRSFLILLQPEFTENIGLLGRMIQHQRALTKLGDPNTSTEFDHQTNWFSPRKILGDTLQGLVHVWREIGSTPDLSDLPEGLELLSSERMWKLMTRDLVFNIAKYAARNEPITISWAWGAPEERRGTLRMRNFFVGYDADLDDPERLGEFGMQGSAGSRPPRQESGLSGLERRGTGMGLWGARSLADVLGMELIVRTAATPQAHSATRGSFSLELKIPRHLVRTRH
ncbi:MAG: hypothetical protein ACOZJX_11170 [Pseudomonadota bacterium]